MLKNNPIINSVRSTPLFNNKIDTENMPKEVIDVDNITNIAEVADGSI